MLQMLLFISGDWDAAKGLLRDDLEHLQSALNQRWAATFGEDNQLKAGTVAGDSTAVTRYVANTGTNHAPKWDQVNLANGVTGRLPFAHLASASRASVVLGRGSNGAGDIEELTLGSGLSINGTVLSAIGPRGWDGESDETRDRWPRASTTSTAAGAAPQVVGSVSLTGQQAAITTTAVDLPSPLPVGVYRVTYSLRKTQAGPSASSATVTFTWTDGGVACSKTFAAFTTNTTNVIDTGSILIHADAASTISYAVAYASS